MIILKRLHRNLFKGRCTHPSIKIEADFCADPFWCDVCGYNLDIDDFPLSEDLNEELFNWIQSYKEIPMDEHNRIGRLLTDKVIEELGSDYPIIFIEQ